MPIGVEGGPACESSLCGEVEGQNVTWSSLIVLRSVAGSSGLMNLVNCLAHEVLECNDEHCPFGALQKGVP